jgi:PII-like signaling protein
MSQSMKLLRIYTSESAYYGDNKVYAVIATRARDARLAGATILRADVGFGRSAHLRTRHVLEDEQSVVIEIVDEDTALRAFVTSIDDVTGVGLITLEAVEVLKMREDRPEGTHP